MIFGLPMSTFFMTAGVWLLSIIAAIIYGVTYKDSDTWWTLDELFDRKSRCRKEDHDE